MKGDAKWLRCCCSTTRTDPTTTDAELFLYPGKQRLFADNSLPSYDEHAATLLTERVLSFLDAK